ncbi:hypothetical protein KKA53_00915 [Candidatus Dependentiae bacterium]|nr:hypothetical protein [Candidatus Dependentiae bacterium]
MVLVKKYTFIFFVTVLSVAPTIRSCALGGGYGALGAAVAGGATFAALSSLEPEGFESTRNKLLAASTAALIGGGLTYFIGSCFKEKGQACLDSYFSAKETLDRVGSSLLLTTSIDSLSGFIIAHYGTTEPFCFALREIEETKKELDKTSSCLGFLLENIKRKKSVKNKKLYEKSKELLGQARELYALLLKRKTFIAGECDHERIRGGVLWAKQLAGETLQSEQLVAVKESYEKTVAYGISSTDELWPMVTVISELRKTVRVIRDVLNYCVAEREACLQKISQDDRYRLLAEEFVKVIVCIKEDFPFEMFEQRIKEVFYSPEYQKQGERFEEKERHLELVETLRKMQDDLEATLSDVKGTVAEVKQEMSRVEDKVGAVSDKVSSLRHDVSYIRRNMRRR